LAQRNIEPDLVRAILEHEPIPVSIGLSRVSATLDWGQWSIFNFAIQFEANSAGLSCHSPYLGPYDIMRQVSRFEIEIDKRY
jgi:hypothetical protein